MLEFSYNKTRSVLVAIAAPELRARAQQGISAALGEVRCRFAEGTAGIAEWAGERHDLLVVELRAGEEEGALERIMKGAWGAVVLCEGREPKLSGAEVEALAWTATSAEIAMAIRRVCKVAPMSMFGEMRVEELCLLIDRCADGMMVVDAEGKIRLANGACERLFGRGRDELIGSEFGYPILSGEETEITLLRGDGKQISVEMRAALTPWSCGTGRVVTLRDITERKAAENEIRRLNSELEARVAERTAQLVSANRAKDHFLAMLSHELRTPLTPVLIALESLKRDSTVPKFVQGELEVMRRHIELEARLIDDLLDLTRISRGKLALNLEIMDGEECVRQAFELCKSALDKPVSLVSEFGAGTSYISGDASRLQQVFWNLIKNAIKFTPANGKVVVRSSVAGGRYRVEVSDNGIGIDAAMMPKIFDAFEQGDPTIMKRFGGLGLGLSISKAIVDMHRGELRVSSDGRGSGSTFVVELSTVPSPLRMRRRAAAPAVRQDGDGRKRGYRILIVEDHEATRKLLARVLASGGHEVTCVSEVGAALRHAEGERCDLLISDIGLPDGTGHDLMRQLRQRGLRMNGIALSGYGMESDVRGSKEVGFAEHLTKPVDVGKLEAVIERIMEEGVGTRAE